MNIKYIKDSDMFKDSYEHLEKLIEEAYQRFDEKLYINIETRCSEHWCDENVYLYGNRNVVNWVSIRMINYNNRMGLGRSKGVLYVYPVSEYFSDEND